MAFLTFSGVAAANDEGAISWAGFGGLTLGGRFLDMTNVNHYLDSAGAKLPDVIPALGGHAAALLSKRFIVGGRGDTALFTARGSQFDAKYIAAGGSAEFGYAAVNNEYGLACPFVGVGGQQSVLNLVGGNRLDLIKSYNGQSVARQTAAIASVGFAYRRPVRIAATDAASRFALFMGGIGGGATFNIGDRAWRDPSGRTIAGLGSAPLATFFLNVDLSFGGGATRPD